jgi:hypothetical protein
VATAPKLFLADMLPEQARDPGGQRVWLAALSEDARLPQRSGTA